MIGAHLSKSSLESEIEDSGSEIAQIFLSNPRSYQPASDSDVKRLNEIENELVVHLPYLVNIPSFTQSVRDNSAKLLKITLDQSGKNLNNFVVHGGQGGKESSIDEANQRWIDFIKRVDLKGRLLIENTAGGNSAPGRNLTNLVDLIKELRAFADVGVCFDTCHAYAAGYDNMLDAYEFLKTNLGRVDLVHLNDSKDPLNSSRDRHELLYNGSLGRSNLDSLIVRLKEDKTKVILETPGDTSIWAKEISDFKSLGS